jgi:hypothetical protein
MVTLSPRKIITAMLFVLLWSVILVAGENKSCKVTNRIVVADVGLSTPESVEYYPAEDVYLVTNINGSPFESDGNGFISKIKPDGSLLDLKWIDGTRNDVTLNAPKGAAIKGNLLYIADIDQVQIFELPSGKQKSSVEIEGSTFLNGITPGEGDYVYVTDSGFKEGFKPSGTDAVYQVWSDGKYKAIIQDKNMGNPNGILWDGKELLVVTMGSGKLLSLSANGKYKTLPSPPKGSLDGIVRINNGPLLISSWDASAIYQMYHDQTYSVLADSLPSPADLGVDTKRDRVLTPLFTKNEVVLLQLAMEGKKSGSPK